MYIYTVSIYIYEQMAVLYAEHARKIKALTYAYLYNYLHIYLCICICIYLSIYL